MKNEIIKEFVLHSFILQMYQLYVNLLLETTPA